MIRAHPGAGISLPVWLSRSALPAPDQGPAAQGTGQEPGDYSREAREGINGNCPPLCHDSLSFEDGSAYEFAFGMKRGSE
jgi:hypothetical protein